MSIDKMKNKSSHPLYNTWTHMRQRCYNKNAISYRYYGAKGIKVCERWHKFENFITDMGEKPNIKFSLDRVDSSKDYYKENCRWADDFTQANNTQKNRFIKYKGEKKTVAEWVRFFGIKSSTFRQRLYVYKWPFIDCIININ